MQQFKVEQRTSDMLIIYKLTEVINFISVYYNFNSKQINQIIMGHNSSNNSSHYKNDYIVVSTNQSGECLLRHKTTHKQAMMRKVSAQSEQQLIQIAQIIYKRRKIKNVHLLQIFQMNKIQEDHFCSNTRSAQLFIQYPFQNLQTQFQQRKNLKQKKQPLYFSESQLWSILYSCALALQSLYLNDLHHQSLTKQQIFIDKQGIIKLADPIVLQLQKNYTKVIQKIKQARQKQSQIKGRQPKQKSTQDKNIQYINKMHNLVNDDQKPESQFHISPEQITLVKQNNFYYYDKQKSDIYVLATLMVELSTLNEIKINYQRLVPLQLSVQLKQLRERYSMMYINLLSKMLQIAPKDRVNLQQIIDQVQTFSTQDGQSQLSRKQLSNRKNDFTELNMFLPAKNNNMPNISQPQPQNQTNIPFQFTFSQNNQKSTSQISYNSSVLNSNTKIVFNGNNHIVQSSFKQIPSFNYTPYNNLFASFQSDKQKVVGLKATESQTKFQPFYQKQKERFSLDKFGHIQISQYGKSHPQINKTQPINNLNSNQYFLKKNDIKYSQVMPQYISKPQNPIFKENNFSSNSITYMNEIKNVSANVGSNSGHQFDKNKQIKTSKIIIPQVLQISDILTQSKNNTYENIFGGNYPPTYYPQSNGNMNGYINPSYQQNTKQQQKPVSNNIKYSQRMYQHQQRQKQSLSSSRSAVDQLNKIDQLSFQDSSPKQNVKPIVKKQKSINKSAKKYNFYKKQLAEDLVKIDPSQTQNKKIGKEQHKNEVQSLTPLIKSNNLIKQKLNYQSELPNDNKVKIDQLNDLLKKLQKPIQKTLITYEPQIHSQYVEQMIDGCKYMGYKLNGKKHGQGLLYFSDGGYYEGLWYLDQIHGFGKLFFRNNKLAYKGNFNYQLFEGFGTLYNDRPKQLTTSFDFSDMKNVDDYWIYYKGNFKEDSKNGKGVMLLTNGEQFQGYFDHDTIDGQGKYKLMNGKVIFGLWKNNVLIQIKDQINMNASEISSISQNDGDRIDSNSEDYSINQT